MTKEHYVVFGATEKPNKGLICTSDPKNHVKAVTICQLKDGTDKDYGETITADDISGYYTTLMFCNKKSLDMFIQTLQEMSNRWDEWEAEE